MANYVNLFGGHDYSSFGVWELLNSFGSKAAGSSKQDRKKGRSYSQTDVASMMYDRAQLEDERAYNAERWAIEQSVPGMVEQYRQAGMNPILATGIQPGSSAPASGGGASGASGTGEDNGLGIVSTIVDLLTGAAGIGVDVKNAKSQADAVKVEQQNADTAQFDAETRRMEFEDKSPGFKADSQRKQIEASWAEVREQLSTGFTQAQINEANANVDYLNRLASTEEQRKILLSAQTRLANAEASVAEAQFKYAEEFQLAQLGLMSSQAYLADQEAGYYSTRQDISEQEYMYNAVVLPLKQTQLLSETELEIFENEFKQEHMKTDYVWDKVFDCLDTLLGAGALMLLTKGRGGKASAVGKATGKATGKNPLAGVELDVEGTTLPSADESVKQIFKSQQAALDGLTYMNKIREKSGKPAVASFNKYN